MQTERVKLPDNCWLAEIGFPNHSYIIPVNKAQWVVTALIDSDIPNNYPDVLGPIRQIIMEHYKSVREQFRRGSTTTEGVPFRTDHTDLEKAILIAWIMNCEFWYNSMMSPPQLEKIPYFNEFNQKYPRLYDLFVEWAWG